MKGRALDLEFQGAEQAHFALFRLGDGTRDHRVGRQGSEGDLMGRLALPARRQVRGSARKSGICAEDQQAEKRGGGGDRNAI